MQIIMLPLKIISVPLIIIIGESHINENTKSTLLLLLAFLYNNLLGFAARFLVLLLSVPLGILSTIIIGASFLIYLITINIYVKRKIEINITIYIMLNLIAFLIGAFLN